MKALFLGLFGLTALLCDARTLEEINKTKKIRVAFDGETPGFNSYKNGKLVGFEVDLVNEIARRNNWQVEEIVKPFNTLLVALNQDRFDFVGTSHTITDERKKVADFAIPYYCGGAILVTKPGGPAKPSELKGKTVSVAAGTVYFDHLKKLPGIKDVKTFPGENQAFEAMRYGKVDAWATEQFAAEEVLKLRSGEKYVQGEIFIPQENAMIVAKGNTELLKVIDRDLRAMLDGGVYHKLSVQHFGKDIRCPQK